MNALRNLWQIANRDGVDVAWAIGRHRLSERWHEWRFGIETASGVSTQDLGFTDPACRMYVPTAYGSLFWLFHRLGGNLRDDVFIDFGSGKGRALVVAAAFGFRRVLGVELSEALSVIARQNLRKARRRLRCRDVSVVTESAETFAIPPDASVAFFWNPFTGHVLAEVLENLRRSVVEHPRRLRILAAFPTNGDFQKQLRAVPWLKTIEVGVCAGDVSYRLAKIAPEASRSDPTQPPAATPP